MPRRLSSADIIRALTEHGFSFVSQKGSHCKFRNAVGRVVIVPHPKAVVPAGTTGSIIRQSGLTRSAFGI